MGRPREKNVSKWAIYKRNQRARGVGKAHTCRKCGKRVAGKAAVEDHRNGEKFDNRPSNRQMLCRSCHLRKHPEIAVAGGKAS